MSAVVVGLLFLACGWKLYKDAIYTRYVALRNTGHPQYFGGALCGALIFALSFSLDRVASKCGFYSHIAAELFAAVPSFADAQAAGALHQFARILLWALPVTWATTRLLNLPFHRSPSLLMAAARKTRIIDELEDTIYHCLRAKPQLSLALTTKSKKVYVGVPKRHSPDPDRDRVWIAIWPLASGYRDQDGGLHLTTFYDDVRSGTAADSRRLNDYQVVLPISEIQVAQAFDLLAYAKYQQTKYEREQLASRSFLPAPYDLHNPFDTATNNPAVVAPDGQAPLFRIIAHMLPERDRYLLRMYAYFIAATVLAVFLLPASYKALYLAPVAIVACLEAIEPLSVRVENRYRAWKKRRRASRAAGAIPGASM